MKNIYSISFVIILVVAAFFLLKPTEIKAQTGSPFYMETAPCPGGGTYERCWEYCGICYCNPEAQTTCGGPDQ